MPHDATNHSKLLTEIMAINHGVLLWSDHVRVRRTLRTMVAAGSVVRVLPGTYVAANLVHCRATRYAAALAHLPSAVLWGDSAVSALLGRLADTPFAGSERVVLASPHWVAASEGLCLSKHRVPEEFVVRSSGLRLPCASYLAVAATARDDGRLAERVLREGLAKPSELVEALPAFAGTRGQAIRRKVVIASGDNPWSGGERQLQGLMRRAGITGWVANQPIRVSGHVYVPDALFEDARLIVEFDGFEVHKGAAAFEADRRRQNHLILAGYRVLRFTWKRITTDPEGVVAEIRAALAHPSFASW